MNENLIHKEGPFSFVSRARDGTIEVQLPDGHGTGLTLGELKQLHHGARYVLGLVAGGLPIPRPSCRHRCRLCGEPWSHDPAKLECIWPYDDLCGVCSGDDP